MQEYKTESPFDITLSEEQQMSWDMLRKFAELNFDRKLEKLRPMECQATNCSRRSNP